MNIHGFGWNAHDKNDFYNTAVWSVMDVFFPIQKADHYWFPTYSSQISSCNFQLFSKVYNLICLCVLQLDRKLARKPEWVHQCSFFFRCPSWMSLGFMSCLRLRRWTMDIVFLETMQGFSHLKRSVVSMWCDVTVNYIRFCLLYLIFELSYFVVVSFNYEEEVKFTVVGKPLMNSA